MYRALIFSAICLVLFPSAFVSAQEVHQDIAEVVRAEVIRVVDEKSMPIAGTETYATVQTLNVRFLSGSEEGKYVTLENDRVEVKAGQKLYLNRLVFLDGTELYSVRDIDRRVGIYILAALFAAAVLLFGGKQGARSLVSLAGSFLLIVYVLFPLFLAGYSPLLVSVGVGSLILAVAIFATHGLSFRSGVACLGAIASIFITAGVAIFGTEIAHLSGFFSDESMYLNLSTAGTLDFRGLLLGSIIIGVLGVLDDIAVTQVAVVAELKAGARDIGDRQLFQSALRVGKEHVSALVNTIVLAYAGVSLPLLLLFSKSNSPFMDILNNEIFATEIVRTIAGSIGLIATVPITTALAVFFISRFKNSEHTSAHAHH